jgi:hypothetical protein
VGGGGAGRVVARGSGASGVLARDGRAARVAGQTRPLGRTPLPRRRLQVLGTQPVPRPPAPPTWTERPAVRVASLPPCPCAAGMRCVRRRDRGWRRVGGFAVPAAVLGESGSRWCSSTPPDHAPQQEEQGSGWVDRSRAAGERIGRRRCSSRVGRGRRAAPPSERRRRRATHGQPPPP